MATASGLITVPYSRSPRRSHDGAPKLVESLLMPLSTIYNDNDDDDDDEHCICPASDTHHSCYVSLS